MERTKRRREKKGKQTRGRREKREKGSDAREAVGEIENGGGGKKSWEDRGEKRSLVGIIKPC